MIDIKNLKLQFGSKIIYDNISYFIGGVDKIGIIGDNGCGKTTLLKSICNDHLLDHGEIKKSDQLKIGYLRQDSTDLPSENLLDYLKKATGYYLKLEQLQKISNHVSSLGNECSSDILKKYQDTLEQFELFGGYGFESEIKSILSGLGFRKKDFNKNCQSFSGGWKIRIALAEVLLSNNDLLLMDEPTNHLDTESLDWLEKFLSKYAGALLVVSHDRKFLDNTVNKILEIESGNFFEYKGNYSYYLKEKQNRIELLKKEAKDQNKQISEIETFIEKFRYKASKAKQVQSRIKKLEKLKKIEIYENSRKIKIRFPECITSGREVIKVKNLEKSYGEQKVLSNVNFEVERKDRMAIVGYNGSGKTTLLKLLAEKELPTEGDIEYGHNVKKAFFSQLSTENLSKNNTIWEEICSVESDFTDDQKRDMLGAFLFKSNEIYKTVAVLSGGEKSRLALLKVVMQKANFLILDEPTNHLDYRTKDLFQEALLGYPGTIIIVSHDRYFINKLVNRIIEIRDGICYDYRGDYDYYISKKESLETKGAFRNFNKDTSSLICDSNKKNINNRKGKQQRRLEAEKRNIINKKLKKLSMKKNTLEEYILEMEVKKEALEQKFLDHNFYNNSKEVQDVNRQLNNFNREVELAYQQLDDLESNFESEKKLLEAQFLENSENF